jgi:hypothetical protein
MTLDNEIPTRPVDRQPAQITPATTSMAQPPVEFRYSPLEPNGAAVVGPSAFTSFSFVPLDINWEDYEQFVTSAYEAIYDCK